MRWDNLTAPPVEGDPERAAPATPPLPLALPGAVARTFDTPEFAGMTFYEIQAKSIINRVPGASRVPFEWTINPYRGCSHACVYCFARNTHTYLDLDAGRDFDTQIVVKVNAGELLRRELAAPTLAGRAHRDGHQRRLLPARRGPLPADAADHRGAARLRQPVLDPHQGHADPARPDLLRQAAEVTAVGISLLGRLRRRARSGARSSRARRARAAGWTRSGALTDAGFAVGVLMAPILPGLTDTDESIEATVAGDRRRRRDQRRRRCRCTCAPAPGSGSRPGWPASTRTWCPATASSTGPARTRRRRTSGR